MLTIWKYELGIVDEQTITLPVNYELLALQMQNNTPCIWVLVDTESPQKDIKLVTYGTGHTILNHSTYIGTYQTGPLVFHVFVEDN